MAVAYEHYNTKLGVFFHNKRLPFYLVTLINFSFFALQIRADTGLPIAKNYRVFGPMPPSSRGADPLSVFSRPLLDTLSTIKRFPSDPAVGGFATWRDVPFNSSSNGVITVPFPDAQEPYEAFAVGNFTIARLSAHPHLLKCDQPALIRVDQLDTPTDSHNDNDAVAITTHCPADVYDDGRALCSVRLHPGTYTILVYLQASSNETSFSCNYFFDPQHQPESLLLPINDTVVPSIVVYSSHGYHSVRLAGPHMSVTVMNIHDTQWATAGSVRLLGPPKGLHLAPQSSSDDHYPLPRIAPRQVRQLRLDLLTDSTFLDSDAKSELPSTVTVTVAVKYEFGEGVRYECVFDVDFDVAVWGTSHSYHFTYIDVDASVQAAAVVPPMTECINAPAGQNACPVLLSTHGAGVDALAGAWTNSYRTQNQSWVLLPTGRRKFGMNWEGPQMRTAITALRALADGLPGVPPKVADRWRARRDFWLQAGHSMGGHGALLLATHFPDMLVAALPAMGWLRLSSYIDQTHRDDISFSDAALRAMQTVASAEYSADLYSENLLGIPFLARVGSDDDNVPPSNLRKFVRLLRENEIFLNLSSVVGISEKKGEGHWFDGVVDDDDLQPFLDAHLSARRKPILPVIFSIFTINPASTGSRGGLRILSLEVPYESSRLRVRRDAFEKGGWAISTENVRRFRYEVVSGILERPTRLYIDGDQQGIGVSPESLDRQKEFVDLCVTKPSWSAGSKPDIRQVGWKRCKNTKTFGKSGSIERGPDNTGPAFQVLSQRKVAVVYPEGDSALMGFAIRYANALYIRGVSAMVTTDSNVTVKQLSDSGDVNLVLLGGPSMNRMAKAQYENGYSADVSFTTDGFCVGKIGCFKEIGTGVAFLSGGPGRTLLFYVAGTDPSGMEGALDFLPYSAASNVPEWVIVKASRGWGFRGLGGVVAMGYWDWMWRLERRKVYPSEFGFDSQVNGASCTSSGNSWVKDGSRTSWAMLVVGLFLVAGLVFVIRARAKHRYVSVQQDDDVENVGRGISRKGIGKVDEIGRIENVQVLLGQGRGHR